MSATPDPVAVALRCIEDDVAREQVPAGQLIAMLSAAMRAAGTEDLTMTVHARPAARVDATIDIALVWHDETVAVLTLDDIANPQWRYLPLSDAVDHAELPGDDVVWAPTPGVAPLQALRDATEPELVVRLTAQSLRRTRWALGTWTARAQR